MKYDRKTTDSLFRINNKVNSDIIDTCSNYFDAGFPHFSIPMYYDEYLVVSVYENNKVKYRHFSFENCHILLKFDKNEDPIPEYFIYPANHGIRDDL